MHVRLLLAGLLCVAAAWPSFGADLPAPSPGGPGAPSLPAGIVGVEWEWSHFADGMAETTISDPDHYTLSFSADGAVAIRADCNRGRGTYSVADDRHISFGPAAVTRAMCPAGSLDSRFLGLLPRVASYFELDGDLLLELPLDSGTLRFRRASK